MGKLELFFIKRKNSTSIKIYSSSKNRGAMQEINTEIYGNDSIKCQSFKISNSLMKELKSKSIQEKRNSY